MGYIRQGIVSPIDIGGESIVLTLHDTPCKYSRKCLRFHRGRIQADGNGGPMAEGSTNTEKNKKQKKNLLVHCK
jgi:hypothetical protein